jgi:hypothetical protein
MADLILIRHKAVILTRASLDLAFQPNDITANTSILGHSHPKPVFRNQRGKLRLANVPVPARNWKL